MQKTIDLPEEMSKWAQSYCTNNKMELSELVQKLITQFADEKDYINIHLQEIMKQINVLKLNLFLTKKESQLEFSKDTLELLDFLETTREILVALPQYKEPELLKDLFVKQ